jgi:hypothetical protein
VGITSEEGEDGPSSRETSMHWEQGWKTMTRESGLGPRAMRVWQELFRTPLIAYRVPEW